MQDRLRELLDEHQSLFGVICRDPTMIELELIALAGYHVVFLDLEHGSQSDSQAVQLTRTISHLGMVPLVRIPECSRSHVQVLLDGGVQILALPDVRSAQQAAGFVKLGKYPPLGQRGVCSSSANFEYCLSNPEHALRTANEATRLMVMIESDEGFAALDAILKVEGIDILTVGPADWASHSGIYGENAKAQLAPKIEHVLRAAIGAGKITTHAVFNPEDVAHFRELGVHIIFVGVDVNLKRQMLKDTLNRFHDALST